jgi:hypothetical protein
MDRRKANFLWPAIALSRGSRLWRLVEASAPFPFTQTFGTTRTGSRLRGWGMIFRQLFDGVSSTYSYLLASRQGGEALIIDPTLEKVDRYIQLLNELDLRLLKASTPTYMPITSRHRRATGRRQRGRCSTNLDVF